MPMLEAAPSADIIVTSTDDKKVVDKHHFKVLEDEAIVCNSGHFNVELNIPALAELAVGALRRVRPFVDEYTLPGGRRASTSWPRAGSCSYTRTNCNTSSTPCRRTLIKRLPSWSYRR